MAITVTIPAVLARYANGIQAHKVEGQSVGEALATIGATYPEFGRRLAQATNPANAFVAVYLNDEDTRLLQGEKTPTSAGDHIALVSAIAGG
jgi:molybdopterin converting factor small subunit